MHKSALYYAAIAAVCLEIIAPTNAFAESRTLTNRRPSKSEIICRQSFADWKRAFGSSEAKLIQHRCYVWRYGHGVLIYKTPKRT